MNRGMNRWMPLVAVALCGLSAGAARADQCAWVSPAAAERAREALADRSTVVSYCEPCGDLAPGAPRSVTEVAVRPVGDGSMREVVLDGQGIDLAYTYVRTAPDRFDNLATLSGCHATGVAPTLDIDAATSTGVLIRADDPRNPPPEPPSFATPPPPVSPAPPRVVHVTRTPRGWLFALLACATTAAAALALAIVALTHRGAPRSRRSS